MQILPSDALGWMPKIMEFSGGCSFFYSKDMLITTLEKSSTNMLARYEHTHTQYEFFLPLTPIPFLLMDGAIYFGETGWAFSIPSGHLHGVKYDVPDISYNNILIKSEYFDLFIESRGMNAKLVASAFYASEELNVYITLFKKEFKKGNAKSEIKLNHLTALICGELIDGFCKRGDTIDREISGYQRGVRSVAEFLNANYDKHISLEEMADMCGFSRNYFTTSFRQMFGDTPLVYLTKLRISKAKQLLATTNDTVETIAQRCGYNKQNTFTQAFKTMTGLNPTQYRLLGS